jgi:catechol 2,3-dioxygenase-like lactoylglutathione lyase family enzyme
MTRLGNHLKMHLPKGERERARRFYADVLGCRAMDAPPYPDLDLYEFDDGTVVGLFFLGGEAVLSAQDSEKAVWLEIKTSEPENLQRKLEAFGVKKVEFPDSSRFYFQAPGGQVFRVAPLDGGLWTDGLFLRLDPRRRPPWPFSAEMGI